MSTKLRMRTVQVVDNSRTVISERLDAIFSHVWVLTEQEKSYLNRHFMLIRTLDQFIKEHIDNHTVQITTGGSTVINGGIHYQCIYQGFTSLIELKREQKIRASFRYQEYSAVAYVIIRLKDTNESDCVVTKENHHG